MRLVCVFVIFAVFSAVFFSGCGGDSDSGNEVSISIDPTDTIVFLGYSCTFTATVTGSDDTVVIWSIQEGSTGGTITSSGVYTSANPGTYHVVATSHADPTKTATARVQVFGSI